MQTKAGGWQRFRRMTAGGLVVLLSLALLGAGFLLIPAHLQIRGIDVVLPAHKEILASEWLNAQDGPVRLTFVNTASQRSARGRSGYPGFLLEWRDGRRFLIDTGMNHADAVAFGAQMELLFGAEPTRAFGPVEKQIGPQIQQIRGIGLTHLHTDHAAGLPGLCRAMVDPAVIFQTHHQARQHNLHTTAGADLVASSGCSRRELDRGVLKAVPGFAGLVAVAAGGHTPGSTLFLARVRGTLWIFAGDLVNTRKQLEDNAGKGWLYSHLIVPENTALLGHWRAWLKQAASLPDTRVVISHDLDDIEASGIEASGIEPVGY